MMECYNDKALDQGLPELNIYMSACYH